MKLTQQEITGFRSMSCYWREVRKRDDKSPLIHEMQQAQDILGIRILDFIELYLMHLGADTSQ